MLRDAQECFNWTAACDWVTPVCAACRVSLCDVCVGGGVLICKLNYLPVACHFGSYSLILYAVLFQKSVSPATGCDFNRHG